MFNFLKLMYKNNMNEHALILATLENNLEYLQ